MENNIKSLYQDLSNEIIKNKENRLNESSYITFINQIKANSNDFNSLIIAEILYNYLNNMKTRIMSGLSPSKQLITTYNGVITPEHIKGSNNQLIANISEENKEANLINFLITYNSESQNMVVYFKDDSNSTIPVVFDKAFFDSLGFTITFTNESVHIEGPMEANEELLKRLIDDDLDDIDCSNFSYDIIEDYIDIRRRRTKIEKFQQECIDNRKNIVYEICKNVLFDYQSGIINFDNVIEISIPALYTFTNVSTAIDEKALKKLRDFMKSCNNHLDIIYVLYNDEYVPVTIRDFSKALQELNFSYEFNNDGNMITIKTSVKDFEDLVININKNKIH